MTIVFHLSLPPTQKEQDTPAANNHVPVRDISLEALEKPELKYQERARRAGILREGTQYPCMQACAATFFTSVEKITSFHSKQKMRLRTFDDGGKLCASACRRYQRSMSAQRRRPANKANYTKFSAV